MTAVTFVLVVMAHGAAFSHFALRHGGPDGGFDVGFPVQCMRGASFRPLSIRENHGVAFRFTLGKFAQVTGAAGVSGRHADVFGVIRFLLGVHFNVAVDTAYFLQIFLGTQFTEGTQVIFDFFQLFLFVIFRIFRFQFTYFVQVSMCAAFPGLYPDR